MKNTLHIFIAFLLLNPTIKAQADLSSRQVVNDIIVYRDYHKKDVFYYAPRGLQMVKDTDGKPHFTFLQMRYTGTRTSGDQGSRRFRSLLSFKVAQSLPSKKERDAIKQVLRKQCFAVNKLQSIPVSNLKAILVHAAENKADSTAHKISGGFFENSGNTGSNFRERDFTLRLNNADAQLFSESLQGNQPTLSINYAFATKGYNAIKNELSVSDGDIMKDLKEKFTEAKDSITETDLQEQIINAGAVQIQVDTKKWPDLIQKIDINERIPPDYAALDVYCFDFNNELNAELYAKRIELKAKGVGGSDVTFKKTFKYNWPDEYAKTIRFVYAVKLSKPYQYRITEIYHDGSFTRSEWKTRNSWHEILDITSQQSKEN